MDHYPGRSRALLGLLVLASVTIITFDARHETSDSPIDPLRTAMGSVLGPVQDAAAAGLEPVTDLPGHFADVTELRQENAALQAERDDLATQLRAADANANRDDEVAGIAELADTSGFAVVPAQVIGLGPAQSFSRTVTIDAGREDGVVPDLTVINADGLVGRVIAAAASSATILLIIDSESTVGGRLGESMELGFLDGDGQISGNSTLELSLVDHTISPWIGDTVVTWGSRNQAPYLAGVPIGSVVSVRSSPAELTETAQVDPFVDFSSLDIVAVVTSESEPATGLAQGGTP
ncbi:MAG: rod shape-determining protein MreC [Nocardioidaceae bacterium]|nr:rod shape-determining protein MreC [Nocardioidaceae bacterium]